MLKRIWNCLFHISLCVSQYIQFDVLDRFENFIIYIIIRDCTRVGAFPRAFCVPNSVALASLTLQVVYWAIH